MTNIVPISEFRDTDRVFELSEKEPLFVTRNGYGSRVFMTIDEYDKLKRYQLNVELAEALRRSEQGGNIDAKAYLSGLLDDRVPR